MENQEVLSLMRKNDILELKLKEVKENSSKQILDLDTAVHKQQNQLLELKVQIKSLHQKLDEVKDSEADLLEIYKSLNKDLNQGNSILLYSETNKETVREIISQLEQFKGLKVALDKLELLSSIQILESFLKGLEAKDLNKYMGTEVSTSVLHSNKLEELKKKEKDLEDQQALLNKKLLDLEAIENNSASYKRFKKIQEILKSYDINLTDDKDNIESLRSKLSEISDHNRLKGAGYLLVFCILISIFVIILTN
ncbi:hypothetical protein [Psittacicella gerlachiana]|uniref:Uncharacterized protein n=1 Tax=Psittacicella gerlachiana TaxID=2028574 RepID=A0A3A1YBL6_9GAMM|nr:hypothetical protein [Psittacicella gerlachiana]RIY35075.1 hypothetical protein CKF59_04170 [Psittacicella gerlachiana]